MIFQTMAERDRVLNIISNRNKFEDIKADQMAVIWGMYYAIEAIENMKGGAGLEPAPSDTLGKIIDEIADTVLDNCVDHIEAEIAEMYVSFQDENAE